MTRVLGYQTFPDPDGGSAELLVRHERGRFVVERSIPCDRAIPEGRLYTDGHAFFVAYRGRYREVR